MSTPVRVLLIDDDEGSYELISAVLSLTRGAFRLDWVATYREGLRALEGHSHDVYLLDYRLDEFDGLQLLRRASEMGATAPVIFLTSEANSDVARDALRAGAADYLDKGKLEPATLERAIRYTLERARAVAALRESEAQYRMLFEANPGSMWVYDRETLRFLAVNAAAVAHYGYSREDFLAMRITDLHLARDTPMLLEIVSNSQAGLHSLGTWSQQTREGRTIAVEITTQEISLAGKAAVLVLTNDITERLGAEQALQQSHRFLQSTIDALSAHIAILDAGGAIMTVNAAWCRFAERNELDMPAGGVGANYLRVCESARGAGSEEAPLVAAGIREVQAGMRDEFVLEYPCHSPTEQRWFAAHVTRFENEGRRHIVLAHDNITSRRRAEITLHGMEHAMQRAQRLEAVGRLAGGVAHDFNNLLTVIGGFTSFALDRVAAVDPLRDDLEEVKRAAERAAELTGQLLAFSRHQLLQPRVIDLNRTVAEMGRMLERLIGGHVRLDIRPAPALGAVRADPAQLEQVIVNLAVNARDAMPDGGRLILETSNVELDEVSARTHGAAEPGPYVMLAVSDTGNGMDEETRAHIFEPFFTTKEVGKGTGLGLATVYGIVNQSGGSIDVSSQPGRGATFTIYLPRVDDAIDRSGAPEARAEGSRGWETVLLVEDDAMVRHLAAEALKRSGFDVVQAAGGEEAVFLCEQHLEPIHLLVTDMVMPKMSGRKLAERLAALRPQMKVLFMSGFTQDETVHRQVQNEGLAFIAKPFLPEAFTRKVREVLDRGPLG